MSWHDRNGPWAKAMRRRVFRHAVNLTTASVLLAISIGMPIWIAIRTASPGVFQSMPGWLMGPFAMMALAALWGAVLAISRIRRDRLFAKIVPAHDGLVCPGCRTILPDSPLEGACPKCRKPYAADDLRSYWEQYALSPWLLGAAHGPDGMVGWVYRRLARGEAAKTRRWAADEGAADRAVKGMEISGRWFLTGAGATLLGLVAFMWVAMKILGESFVVLVARFGPMLVIFLTGMSVGIYFFRRAAKRVLGHGRYCAECGYQQAPSAASPARCPECGGAWSEPGGSVLAQRPGRPWELWAGGAVMVGTAILLILAQIGPLRHDWAARWLPTSVLVEHIVLTHMYDNEEWAALNTRALSAEEERGLAVGLLDKRQRRGHFSRGAEGWFAAKLKAKTLPADLVQRYYREMAKFWVIAPASAKVGETFRISVGREEHCNIHSSVTGNRDERVYVGGFFVGDSGKAHARGASSVHLGLLDWPQYNPVAEVTPDHAGPLRVRLVLWFVVRPSGVRAGPIEWQADGTPVIPPGAEWSERIEVEKTVQVQE